MTVTERMGSLRDTLSAAPLGHATSYPDTYDAALLFRGAARAAAAGNRHRGSAAVHRRDRVDRLRAHLARCTRQAGSGDRLVRRAGDLAVDRRVEVGQALSRLVRADALHRRRRGDGRDRARPVGCRGRAGAGDAGRALGVRTAAHRGTRGREPRRVAGRHRPLRGRPVGAGGGGAADGRDAAHRSLPFACARSPASPTSRRSPSPIAVRASIAPACCAISCRIAITLDSTSIASSASSSTSWPHADAKRCRCMRVSRGAAASTSIRFAPTPACRCRPTCARRGSRGWRTGATVE